MSWLTSLFIGYLILVALMFVLQRSLLYPGAKERPSRASYQAGDYREVTTRTEDGLELHHWYLEPSGEGRPVVVVFHGNGGHYGHRAAKYRALAEAGFGLFLASYRGYGGNPGRPSEDGLSADARSVLQWLSDEGVPSSRLVIYGESLGSAVAVRMAAEEELGALVLEAPMSSIAEVAQSHYWYLPARWLLLDKWNSMARIDKVAEPILVVHGGRDGVVPQRFGRKLFAAAHEPKEALWLEAGGHNNLWEFAEVRQEVLKFLESQLPVTGNP